MTIAAMNYLDALASINGPFCPLASFPKAPDAREIQVARINRHIASGGEVLFWRREADARKSIVRADVSGAAIRLDFVAHRVEVVRHQDWDTYTLEFMPAREG